LWYEIGGCAKMLDVRRRTVSDMEVGHFQIGIRALGKDARVRVRHNGACTAMGLGADREVGRIEGKDAAVIEGG
jgi:hypothetical protein